MKFIMSKRYYFSSKLVKKYNLPKNNGTCIFSGTFTSKFQIKDGIYNFVYEDLNHISENPFIEKTEKIVLHKQKEKFEQFIETEESKTEINNDNKIINNTTSTTNASTTTDNDKPWL